MLLPLFVLLLLLGREEDKKTRSVLLLSQPVVSKDCPLSAGCWSSLLRGSRIQQPNLKKGQKRSRSYEAYLIIMKRGKGFFGWCAGAHFRFPFTSRGSRGSYAAAFPGPFLLVLRPEAIASS